jgi:hypothetical protein
MLSIAMQVKAFDFPIKIYLFSSLIYTMEFYILHYNDYFNELCET